MKSLENFKPLLRTGRILPYGTHLIYETQKPFDQLILPVETADFLVLCDGEHTMSEIVENIYRNNGNVRFRTILRTLHFLSEKGFLDNSAELNDVESSTGEIRFMNIGPIFNIPMGHQIYAKQERPAVFYFIAMVIILSAIFSVEHYAGNWLNLDFLRVKDSYIHGALAFFVISSVLLSARGLIKTLMLLLLTGRAYKFRLTFTGYAFHYNVSSDSLFLIQNRLYTGLYYLASILSILPLGALAVWGADNFSYSTQTLQIATLLFLIEVNPFSDGDLSQLIRSLYPDEMIKRIHAFMKSSSVISLTHSEKSNSTASSIYYFRYFGIVWAAAVVTLATLGFNDHLPQILNQTFIKTSSAIPGFYFLILLGIFCASAAFNLYAITADRFIHSIKNIYNYVLHNRLKEKVDVFNEDSVLTAIEDLPIFNYFPRELLNMLVQKSQISRFTAGAPVIIQGSEGKELFVLLSGHLNIQKRHGAYGHENLGEIWPQSIFGEVAVLEDCKRSADVVATEDSVVLSIPARTLRQASEENQYIRELEGFRNSIVVNQFFASAPFFKDLSERVVQMFISKGKFEVIADGHTIFKQGDPGNSFYLLLRGHVGVAVNGQPVAQIAQGGFFGEISLIADIPRTGTIFAQGQVQILQISRDSFWEILSQDLAIALFIESIGEMRILEDIELIKGSNSKIA